MQTLRFSLVLSIILFLLTPLFIPRVSFSQVQPAVEFTYRGDINEDGQVNIFDLLEMLKLLSSEPKTDRQRQIANVDKSSDGNVNIFDLLSMLRLLGSGEKPEEIFWGPAIAGLNRLSAAVGDTVGINVINFDQSITAADVKAYIDTVEASIVEFGLDSISFVVPDWFSGGDVSLIVATDTTNSKYLNLQIKQQVQAADGGAVTHPDGSRVNIPAGSLQADAAITVEVPTEDQLEEMNIPADTGTTIVLFGPSGTGFAESVTVAVPWPNSATEADSLGAQYYDETEGAWKAIGTTSTDPEQRLAYVQFDRLTAFKAVKTQVVRVRVLTSSRWTKFRLVSGGAMSLHHLISVSEGATAAEIRGDTIVLSQPIGQPEPRELQPYAQEIVEMVVDMSFNVPDMSEELVFNIKQREVGGTWTHVALANYLAGEHNNRENFWWAGQIDLHPGPYTKTVKISAEELLSQSPARIPTAVDPTTLDKKVLFGYQGWYLCPGDGSNLARWESWMKHGPEPVAENVGIDHWPDMSELSPEERFATEMTLPDGSPAELFSSYLRKTTVRHFKWMEDYDLDGVFVQRPPPGLLETALKSLWFCQRNKKLQNVRAGAEAHGRVFAIEAGWDLSSHTLEDLKNDWIFLVDVLKITESPNYLHHKGKPVLAVQGIADWDDWWAIAVCDSLINWLQEEADPKYQATVLGGVQESWHTQDADTKTDWYPVFRSFDVLYPWFMPYNYEQADCYKYDYLLPGIAEASAAGVEYMPVIYPGFSVFNGNQRLYDYMLNWNPRLGGKFIWLQAYNAVSAGANMIYIGVFDELNEGTPMLKMATASADMPVGVTLATLDMDGYAVPGDWYLRVAGEIGRMLRGEIPLSPEMPLALPTYDPNLDTKVIPEIAMVSIPGGTFEMGSESGDSIEEPVHTVTVSSFQMSQYEITNAQYAAYLNNALEALDEIRVTTNSVEGVFCDRGKVYIDLEGSYDSDNECWISFDGSSFSVAPDKEDWPVVYVTWYGARAFAMKYRYDLPTEAEWEYACRGAQQYEYGTDDGTISSAKANYGSNIGHPTDAGSYPANPFGLYDMSGNVREWCSDLYGSYSSESQSDPQGPDTGYRRVERGGDWISEADQCRSAFRSSRNPKNTSYGYTAGFRVVKRP